MKLNIMKKLVMHKNFSNQKYLAKTEEKNGLEGPKSLIETVTFTAVYINPSVHWDGVFVLRSGP